MATANTKKQNTKKVAQQKRRNREWITFLRMLRYGVNNFTRNAWLTVAATVVMTITLLIMFITFSARNVLVDSVQEVSRKVDMSIYLKTDVKQVDVDKITTGLKNLSNVKEVKYISVEDARKEFIAQNKQDASTIEALNNAVNKFPATLRVSLDDINDTTQLENFVKTNPTIKENISSDRAPSFAGPRRTAIQSLTRTIDFAQKVGIAASVLFIVISSLIIFNTIRMAIFNRRDEIEMMKLIGADKSFIRGPFVVEAMVYGFVAAIVATVLGFIILYASKDTLSSYGIAIEPTIKAMTMLSPFVLLSMIVLGAIIGIVSSFIATRRYLKV